MRGHGSSDEGEVMEVDFANRKPVGGVEGPVGLGRASDAEFRREWERRYLLSVRAAVSEVLLSSAWVSEPEARVALAEALQRRGVHPDPDAVRAGAALISRGRRPKILSLDLRPAGGRRRR